MYETRLSWQPVGNNEKEISSKCRGEKKPITEKVTKSKDSVEEEENEQRPIYTKPTHPFTTTSLSMEKRPGNKNDDQKLIKELRKDANYKKRSQ